MSKKQAIKARRARDGQRKAWTISDPCLYCRQPGPHEVKYSHVTLYGAQYKVTCCRCKKYQKFVSQKTKDQIDQQVTA